MTNAEIEYEAMKLQKEVNTLYFKLSEGRTGFEKLKIFYLSYLQIFIHHPEFYKFINEFDSFISSEESANTDVIDPYESVVGQYEKVYMKAYEEGIKDGSVKEQRDISMFYFATTHALLELCKKLSFKAAVLNQDKVIEKQAQVECMIDIVLSTLNNN